MPAHFESNDILTLGKALCKKCQFVTKGATGIWRWKNAKTLKKEASEVFLHCRIEYCDIAIQLTAYLPVVDKFKKIML